MQTSILDNLKLKRFLDKLEWENNIPKNINYTFTGNCEICINLAIANITAPYFVGNVTTKELIELFNEIEFPVVDDLVNSHRDHIKAEFIRDSDISNSITEDMRLIESDLPKQIDAKLIIDSTLRGLYARRLYLEKKGEYDKEYREIVAQLRSYLDLKLKMSGVIKEDGITINLKDMVDKNILESIKKVNNENTGNY